MDPLLPPVALQQPPPLATAVSRSSPKKSFISRMAGSVANHAYLSLAIIIVLVVLLIGVYTYYHGFLILGPYAKSSKSGYSSGKKKGKSGKASKASKSSKASSDSDASGDEDDPEIESLINSIHNS